MSIILPPELKNVIIDTKTVSGHGKEDANNFASTDKLYLLSTAEVWAQSTSNAINYDTARDKTRQLDCYNKKGVTTSSYEATIKKDSAETAAYWWLRCAASYNDGNFYFVGTNGNWNNTNAYITLGVSPAFRIGK